MKRKSLFGPLVLIGIGALLLLRNFRPELYLFDLFATHWPWILVVWGAFRLLEFGFARLLGWREPQPLGGGAVLMAFLLVLAGSIAHGVTRPTFSFPHWAYKVFGKVGTDFTFPIKALRTPVGEDMTTLEVRGLRGRIRITGADVDQVTTSGRKKTQALEQESARSQADRTDLKVEETGSRIVVSSRSLPGERSSREVSFDIEVRIPQEMSLELNSTDAEFVVRGVSGGVAIKDARRAVSLSRIEGPVRVEGRRLRRIQAQSLGHIFELSGNARNVELKNVAGAVTIRGDVSGTIEMVQLGQPVQVDSKNWKLNLGALPGRLEKRATRSVSIVDARGPLKFTSERVRRIRLENVTGDVEVYGKRADFSLLIGEKLPASLEAEVGRGDIEVIVEPGSAFSVEAVTRSGKARHDFGPAIRTDKTGRAVTLRGTTGEGPLLKLKTGRGDISLKRRGLRRGPERRARAATPRAAEADYHPPLGSGKPVNLSTKYGNLGL